MEKKKKDGSARESFHGVSFVHHLVGGRERGGTIILISTNEFVWIFKIWSGEKNKTIEELKN